MAEDHTTVEQSVPDDISLRLSVIARAYPGVKFRTADRRRPAIEAAALAMGLVAVPSPDIPPGCLQGTIAPVDGRPRAALATALHGVIAPDRDLSAGDRQVADEVLAVLARDGWSLTRDAVTARRVR